MTHLIVQDLELGTELDLVARQTVRGGIGNGDLTVGNAGTNGNELDMARSGGVFIGSPTIVNQFIFDMDTQLLIAPLTEITNTVNNLTATNSILEGLKLPL